MKSTDVALIILIAAVSMVVAYFVGNAILGDPNENVEKLTYIQEIDAAVYEPVVDVFNPYNTNPTQEVYVGRCAVGQIYDSAKGVCRDFDLNIITGGSNLPTPTKPATPVEPDDPDEPDNPSNPDTPVVRPED